MSGGSYDYAYSKIYELEKWPAMLEQMAATCKWAATETQERWDGAANVPVTHEDRARGMLRALLLERAAAKMRAAVAAAHEVEDIMHDVEWVESCDYGPDDLLRPLKEDK